MRRTTCRVQFNVTEQMQLRIDKLVTETKASFENDVILEALDLGLTEMEKRGKKKKPCLSG